jgi:adenine-specific DNA-methyltransferase
MNRMMSDNRIWFGKDGAGVPRQKMFLSEAKEIGLTPHTLWAANEVGTNDSAKKELNKLFDNQSIFDTPKPVGLIQRIIQIACSDEDLVMDFYSGSGTTGHSVLKENYENNRNLRYIMVQFPQRLDSEKKEHKAATDFLDSIGKPRNIAEITKERMRRVAAKIKEENPDYEGDLGFKVFNWDSSNIKQWDGGSENLQKSLEDYVNQIKDGRASMDILYEIMLKSGLQLTANIDEVEVGANKVLSVDNCRLLACLDKEIKSEAVADIASTMVELKNANPDADCMVLFLDSAFADSSGKLNMSETLKQNGFGNIRSI